MVEIGFGEKRPRSFNELVFELREDGLCCLEDEDGLFAEGEGPDGLLAAGGPPGMAANILGAAILPFHGRQSALTTTGVGGSPVAAGTVEPTAPPAPMASGGTEPPSHLNERLSQLARLMGRTWAHDRRVRMGEGLGGGLRVWRGL